MPTASSLAQRQPGVPKSQEGQNWGALRQSMSRLTEVSSTLKHVRKVKKQRVRISGYKNKSELIPISESVMLTAASITLALVFGVANVNVETQLLYGRFSFKDAY